ncbi:MAG: hypothetical protein ACYDCO_20185 [Armatimonadota bacterium]
MSRFHDDNTCASDPGNIRLAPHKLQAFKDDLGFLHRLLTPLANLPDALLAEHLELGDSRAALVVQIQPQVLVAAYSDELDCVAMLRFPKYIRRLYQIDTHTRLLTVNTYSRGNAIARDLHKGPQYLHRYTNFFPLIAEFLSNDIADIEARKGAISEQEWERTAASARQTMAVPGFRPRNGNPYCSFKPA